MNLAALWTLFCRVPVTWDQTEAETQAFSPRVLELPVELDVAIPVRNFRVRDLLVLAPGQLIESQFANGGDLPLTAQGVHLAWTEFEVIENRLAVRVTRAE
jgi:flagellar motor switch protein FliN/FliY